MVELRITKFLLRAMCALAAAAVVAGCGTLEPGMRLNETPASASGQLPLQVTPQIELITPALIEDSRRVKESAVKRDVSHFVGQSSAYRIGSGDLVLILVWNYPELNIAAAGAQALSSSGVPVLGAQTPAAYLVDQDGFIQFPYVGAVKISGLTILEARNLLTGRLLKSIKQPDITLRVQQYRSQKVYVDGEVKSPGNQTVEDVPMTLPEALSRAGGLLVTADQSSIAVTRSGKTYVLDFPLLLEQGINPSEILLKNGDVVRVANRSDNKVYVLGEVTAPKSLPMVNGRMSLTQAIGEAGGLSQISSAAKQVYVVRNAGTNKPVVFNLDAQSPIALALADNFELNPRDVVFVDASGLTRFNRVMSLILPSAVGVTGAYYNVNATGTR